MKKRIMFLALFAITIGIIFITPEKVAKAGTFTDNGNGIITVKYNNSNGVKMKVYVTTANGYAQNYAINSGNNELDIPLTGGNTTYNIKILKQVEGTSYTAVEAYDVTLNLSDKSEVYTYSNVIVNFELSDKVVKKAAALTKNCKTEDEVVKKLHKFVVEYFSYDYEKINGLSSGYIPDIEVVYKDKDGICYDFSTVFAAMLRTQGIAVRVITGYSKKVDGYHAWNQIYDAEDDKWYTVDTTYDICYDDAGYSYSITKTESDYVDIKYIY